MQERVSSPPMMSKSFLSFFLSFFPCAHRCHSTVADGQLYDRANTALVITKLQLTTIAVLLSSMQECWRCCQHNVISIVAVMSAVISISLYCNPLEGFQPKLNLSAYQRLYI